MPFQLYGEVFDSRRVPPEEPVVGDLADDLSDIYGDVNRGLLAFEAGRREEAADRVPLEFGTKTNLIGTPAMISERLRLYRDAGKLNRTSRIAGHPPVGEWGSRLVHL